MRMLSFIIAAASVMVGYAWYQPDAPMAQAKGDKQVFVGQDGKPLEKAVVERATGRKVADEETLKERRAAAFGQHRYRMASLPKTT